MGIYLVEEELNRALLSSEKLGERQFSEELSCT